MTLGRKPGFSHKVTLSDHQCVQGELIVRACRSPTILAINCLATKIVLLGHGLQYSLVVGGMLCGFYYSIDMGHSDSF